MQSRFFPLLVVATFVVDETTFVAAEMNALASLQPKDDNTAGYLTEEEVSSANNEERGGLRDFASKLTRWRPSKEKIPVKVDKAVSTEVNAIVTSGETTEKKVKKLATYVESNPTKWDEINHYFNYIFGFGFVGIMLIGAFCYGWQPLGLGGPRF